MTSLQQTPVKGQGIPPAIPEELQQGGNKKAASSSASRAKAMRDAAKDQQSGYEVAVNIAINDLRYLASTLCRDEVASPFESGKQRDSDAAWAMDWVIKEIAKMHGKTCSKGEFRAFLYDLRGMMGCIYRSLSDKKSFYGVVAKALVRKIDFYGEMVEVAGRQGNAFLQREVMQSGDDGQRPGYGIESMRESYRQTVEAAKALLDVVNIPGLSLLPNDKEEAIVNAIMEMEGRIEAACADFVGESEVTA
ncbi:MAG: hypothetical protein WBA83_16775 [Burkholderiaceae bacterium]